MKVTFENLVPSETLKTALAKTSFQGQISCALLQTTEDVERALSSAPSPFFDFSVFVISTEVFEKLKTNHLWEERSVPILFFLADSWENQFIASFPMIKNFITTQAEHRSLKDQILQLNQQTEQLVCQFEQDLLLANELHRTVNNQSPISIPGISVVTKYIPASGLGGDYFDVFELFEQKQLGILLADSRTHGMAAALLSALMKSKVENFKTKSSFSMNLTSYLNSELVSAHQSKLPGIDFVFAVLDRASLQLELTVCGSPTFLFGRADTFYEPPVTKNNLLGVCSEKPIESSLLQLSPGDRLFFSSDGLTKCLQTSPDSLSQKLSQWHHLDIFSRQTEILAMVNQQTQHSREVEDDITLIQVEISPSALYLTQSK